MKPENMPMIQKLMSDRDHAMDVLVNLKNVDYCSFKDEEGSLLLTHGDVSMLNEEEVKKETDRYLNVLKEIARNTIDKIDEKLSEL